MLYMYVKVENGKLNKKLVHVLKLNCIGSQVKTGLSSPILASLCPIPHPSPTVIGWYHARSSVLDLLFLIFKQMARPSSSLLTSDLMPIHCTVWLWKIYDYYYYY